MKKRSSSAAATRSGSFPAGMDLLRRDRAVCLLPLTALDGITADDACEVIAAGADMVCAISAVAAASDMENAVRAFQNLITFIPGNQKDTK